MLLKAEIDSCSDESSYIEVGGIACAGFGIIGFAYYASMMSRVMMEDTKKQHHFEEHRSIDGLSDIIHE